MVSRIVGKALAEASRECSRLTAGIEVRNVAYATATEAGDALLALLGVDGSDRGGERYRLLPEGIRRAVEEVREQNRRHAVVTDENDGIVARLHRAVDDTVPLVAVTCEKRVKLGADLVVVCADLRCLDKINVSPLGGRIEIGVLCHKGGEKIPRGLGVVEIGYLDALAVELVEPLDDLHFASEPLEGGLDRPLRSAEGGAVYVGHILAHEPVSEELYLALTLLGETVYIVIGVAVANN